MCTKKGRMPEEGLEPTHPCGYWILNPTRLPFHHSGAELSSLEIPVKNSRWADEKASYRGALATPYG